KRDDFENNNFEGNPETQNTSNNFGSYNQYGNSMNNNPQSPLQNNPQPTQNFTGADQTQNIDTNKINIDLGAGNFQNHNNAQSDSPEDIPALIRKVPYNEHVKKEKTKLSRRVIAAIVALTLINVAAMGGMFAAGRMFGDKNDKIASKDSLVESLQSEKSSENTKDAVNTAKTPSDELETTEIAKKVGPAVVGITSIVKGQMNLFGGSTDAAAEGSGIILSADGYIVTNNHVVEGATSVQVTLNTGGEYEAKVIGADVQTDLAVIKIEPKEELTVATLGDSSKVEIGERAIAIGNPMGLEFFGSVTQGIVSAINRNIQIDGRNMNLIQTDAAINSGNSGGALVNGHGEVVGINSVKVSTTGVEGMSFAIPISEAKPIIQDLLEHGYVKGRPIIGIATRDVNEYMSKSYEWPMGAQVMEITSQSAKDAGLEQGDIITAVDGKEIKTGEELTKIKDEHVPNDVLTLDVYKYSNGAKTQIKVTLQEQLPG
ncbi:MAG: trypsin-like peptidase domain-containing protein, partial [Oscillospiraceae bacterium]